MPVTAGTIAAPASEVAICDARHRPEILRDQDHGGGDDDRDAGHDHPGALVIAGVDESADRRRDGHAGNIADVIAVPIKPLVQPCASRKTPMNGPMPDCMSAMKKFRPSRGHRRTGIVDFEFFLPALMTLELLRVAA